MDSRKKLSFFFQKSLKLQPDKKFLQVCEANRAFRRLARNRSASVNQVHSNIVKSACFQKNCANLSKRSLDFVSVAALSTGLNIFDSNDIQNVHYF